MSAAATFAPVGSRRRRDAFRRYKAAVSKLNDRERSYVRVIAGSVGTDACGPDMMISVMQRPAGF